MPFGTRLADGQPIDDPTRARLDLFLSTAALSFGQGTGFGADVQLPFGLINASTVTMTPSGVLTLGDLEARARYAHRLGPVRVQLAAGLALPTGPAIARGGEAAVLEAARYLTLGRGVSWSLVDLDARVALPATFALFVSSTLRVPLGPTRDDFRWGTELRGTAGVSAGPWFDNRLSVSAAFETQWRAQSLEPDPFTGTLAQSVNTGGVWFTVTPAVQVRLVGSLRAFVSGRLPVGQVLEGLQFVPGPGVFVGVGGAFELLPAPLAVEGPARGKLTIVEYGASWCGPCQKLEPQLKAFSLKRPDVVVRTVDASEWPAERLEQALPGVAGLPAMEIFREDGSLLRRLVGEEVFTFEAVIDGANR